MPPFSKWVSPLPSVSHDVDVAVIIGIDLDLDEGLVVRCHHRQAVVVERDLADVLTHGANDAMKGHRVLQKDDRAGIDLVIRRAWREFGCKERRATAVATTAASTSAAGFWRRFPLWRFSSC